MNVDFVDELQNIGKNGNGYELKHALSFVLLQVPSHLYELMPISVLIGTIFVMARFAQSSEFTILRTSGLAPTMALRNLLTLGLGFVLLTFVVGFGRGELKGAGMRQALLSTAETSAMVFMIFLGADMMNAALALSAMPTQLADWVTHLPVAPIVIVMAVMVLYVVLGCVMDELSMLLLTIPVIFPAIMQLDLWGLSTELKAIWFGILVLMTVGIGLIAPPVGLNVYVVNNLAREVPMSETYKGVFPFLAWDALRLCLLLIFPGICLWLVKWM